MSRSENECGCVVVWGGEWGEGVKCIRSTVVYSCVIRSKTEWTMTTKTVESERKKKKEKMDGEMFASS